MSWFGSREDWRVDVLGKAVALRSGGVLVRVGADNGCRLGRRHVVGVEIKLSIEK